jgi:hypothetical protein
LIRDLACSGLGHLTLVALMLGMSRVWQVTRTDQPNEMRGWAAAISGHKEDGKEGLGEASARTGSRWPTQPVMP